MYYPKFFRFDHLKGRDWLDIACACGALTLGVSMLVANFAGLLNAPGQFALGTTQLATCLAEHGLSGGFLFVGTGAFTLLALIIAIVKVGIDIILAAWIAVTAPGVALAYLGPGLLALAVLFGLSACREGIHRLWFWFCPAALPVRKKWREALNHDAKSGSLR